MRNNRLTIDLPLNSFIHRKIKLKGVVFAGFVKLTAVVYNSKVRWCELLMSKLHNNKLSGVLSQAYCEFLSFAHISIGTSLAGLFFRVAEME